MTRTTTRTRRTSPLSRGSFGALPSYGRQLRAALTHDHLCDLVNRYPANQRKEATETRRRAEELFREAMRNPEVGTVQDPKSRVPWFRRWLFWAGDSFGRTRKFHRLGRLLLTAHVLLGIVALVLTWIMPSKWVKGLLRSGSAITGSSMALSTWH